MYDTHIAFSDTSLFENVIIGLTYLAFKIINYILA